RSHYREVQWPGKVVIQCSCNRFQLLLEPPRLLLQIGLCSLQFRPRVVVIIERWQGLQMGFQLAQQIGSSPADGGGGGGAIIGGERLEIRPQLLQWQSRRSSTVVIGLANSLNMGQQRGLY